MVFRKTGGHQRNRKTGLSGQGTKRGRGCGCIFCMSILALGEKELRALGHLDQEENRIVKILVEERGVNEGAFVREQ